MRSVVSSSGSGKIDDFFKFTSGSLFVMVAVDESAAVARRKAFLLNLGVGSVFIG